MEAREVADHLLQRARWSASRSSGPGGQRRDKVETRAELVIDQESLDGLPADVADRLRESLGLDERPLRITSQEERSQASNREIVAARLADLVAGALAPPPPPRRPTRPSRAKRQKRLDEKSRRGAMKRLRQEPADRE